jgi:nitrate reductase gamma subunit
MDAFLFIAFPYVAMVLAVGVGLYRYFTNRYSFSSLASQILENRKLFWGSVPWHYGITLILLAHLLAALFPRVAALVLGNRIRLLVLELSGICLALYALVGLIVLIIRRLPTKSLTRIATSNIDGLLLAVLLLQLITGLGIGIFDRWGSLWYLHTAVPWFWSLVGLHPDMSTVVNLPGFVKVHFVTGFVVILLFPFTRLVHLVMFPVYYLWRPYQVVIWNRAPRRKGTAPTEVAR